MGLCGIRRLWVGVGNEKKNGTQKRKRIEIDIKGLGTVGDFMMRVQPCASDHCSH